jgi:hypothetical protein
VIDFSLQDWPALVGLPIEVPAYVWERPGERVTPPPVMGQEVAAGRALYLPSPGLPPLLRRVLDAEVERFAARLGQLATEELRRAG